VKKVELREGVREVGAPGFEPGASCTPCKRASQAAPRPDQLQRREILAEYRKRSSPYKLCLVHSIAANARTGNVPIPLILTGTAKNLNGLLSGNNSRLHICSTIKISAPSSVV
jgi:hypothetical protein